MKGYERKIYLIKRKKNGEKLLEKNNKLVNF